MNLSREVRNIRLKLANNGFLISYDQYAKDQNSQYDSMSYVGEKSLVFTLKQKNECFAKLIELGKSSGEISPDESLDSEEEEESEEN